MYNPAEFQEEYVDNKILELSVDVTKTAIEHSAAGLITSAETVTKFLEEIAKKLHQLARQT